MMNSFTKFILVLTAAAAVAACEVEKTQEGKLPEVSVEGGQMPEYNVKIPDIDVGTKKKEVTVPTVDVDMPDDE